MIFAATDYPSFWDVLWTMVIFFAWVIWFWLLITAIADLFRRHDMGGFPKVLWIIAMIILPFLGVFIYILVYSKGMTERNLERAQKQSEEINNYVRSVAAEGGAAGEIERAKKLLDSGAITQDEFNAIKAKALG